MGFSVYLTVANNVRKFVGFYPTLEIAEEITEKLISTATNIKQVAVIEIFHRGMPVLVTAA